MLSHPGLPDGTRYWLLSVQAAAPGAGRWESPNASLLPRGLGVDSKPELQRVLEHRRQNQLIKKKKEELEAKRLQCPFEQELLRRQQRLNQVGRAPRPSPCFLQDYPLAQGGARPAVTADEAEPDEDWTQSPPWPASSLGHSLRCVTLDQWFPLSEWVFSLAQSIAH